MKTEKQIRLKTIEEIEKWLNRHHDSSDCSGMPYLDGHDYGKLLKKLTEMKSNISSENNEQR